MDGLGECLFCKIVAGEVPATVVHEDEQTVAIMDINPATVGHLLVMPRQHATDIHEISPEDLAACARTAQLLATRVRDRLGAVGVNLFQSNGKAAGQTVFHLHIHVIPRYPVDGVRLPWTPAPGDRDQIAITAAELSS